MKLLVPTLFAAIGCTLVSATAAAQDLAIAGVVSPVSGCALGSAVNVSMRVLNYGPTLPAGTHILVLYSLDGGPSNNDTIMLGSNLPTNASLVFTFAVPADLSAPGAHALTLAINPAGDINPQNNTLANQPVLNSAPSVGGTLSGPANGASGTLALSGQLGDVVQWEESPDNQRWFKLHNTGATQAFGALAGPTRFRVRVANGPCPAAVSNVHLVTP